MAASREEVYERVKEVLVDQLGVDEGEVTEEASFQEDLDADSLDLVELIMELEDQFDIKISGEDAAGLHASFVGGRACELVRAPRVPRRQCARARGRAGPVRAVSRLRGG